VLQGQLRGDGSGQLRGRAVRQALTALLADASWRPCVPDLLADLDEVMRPSLAVFMRAPSDAGASVLTGIFAVASVPFLRCLPTFRLHGWRSFTVYLTHVAPCCRVHSQQVSLLVSVSSPQYCCKHACNSSLRRWLALWRHSRRKAGDGRRGVALPLQYWRQCCQPHGLASCRPAPVSVCMQRLLQ
jgi:hypothetical protein